MSESTDTDVVEFLSSQHREVERLIDTVQSARGDGQRDAFECLVRLLAVHETAEEEFVHPLVKRRDSDGERIVQERLREEAGAKESLASLEELEVGTPQFAHEFDKLATAVKAHAKQEEREEFPLLSQHETDTTRERLTKMVQTAEMLAPTHPHPHLPDSALGNLAAGPFVALVDRAKDAFNR